LQTSDLNFKLDQSCCLTKWDALLFLQFIMTRNYTIIGVLITTLYIVACQSKVQKNTSNVEVKKLDLELVKRITENMDSLYIERKSTGDFRVIEHYFANDTLENKIMRDSNGHITAIVMQCKGQNIFAEEYYPNGQSMGLVNYRKPGTIDGPVKYFHPNGRIRTIGAYKNGRESGIWHTYDSTGKLLTSDTLNAY
jgi:hypothetical protein